MISDPKLAGVDAVVLDEFHERHLESDLALALLRRLQRTAAAGSADRRDVGDAGRRAHRAYLDGCPILRSEGRLFEFIHRPISPTQRCRLKSRWPPRWRICSSTRPPGDVLVFLPGAAEIRRAERECRRWRPSTICWSCRCTAICRPRSRTAPSPPPPQRKVILSTNVAESSITVEGVTAVIDSGLARIASDSPWSGLPTLEVARISKASATQRAGRAARTAPGRVIRLYTLEDFERRRDHDPPEIMRRELSEMCLTLRAMGIADPLDFDWLDAPPAAAVARAEDLLERLGATGERARRMARYPLHPRLARLVIDAVERGAGEEGCRAAAAAQFGRAIAVCDLMGLSIHDWIPSPDGTSNRFAASSGLRNRRSTIPHALAAGDPDRLSRSRSAPPQGQPIAAGLRRFGGTRLRSARRFSGGGGH